MSLPTTEKKSFVLYCDQIELFKKLTDEQAGALIKTVYSYCGNGREQPVLNDPLIDIVFTSIKTSLDRDHAKWLKQAEANKKNGALGGRPKGK